jgi:hypothetical protein
MLDNNHFKVLEAFQSETENVCSLLKKGMAEQFVSLPIIPSGSLSPELQGTMYFIKTVRESSNIIRLDEKDLASLSQSLNAIETIIIYLESQRIITEMLLKLKEATEKVIKK